jgi:hypothetical protein
VNVYLLEMQGTWDTYVWSMLEEKDSVENMVRDALTNERFYE